MHCMTLMLVMNFMFLFMNHPMSMGLILILQTLTIAIQSGMMLKSFWMSYILTITMLSGMLVLFIYMSSIASNEKFKNSMKMWMYFSLFMTAAMMILLLSEKMIIKNNYLGVGLEVMKSENMFTLNKMFMAKNSVITIMMIMYLLFTMIVSTHLVNITEGPMRLKI